ncbi:MAG: hypothetical protein GXY77_03910 [Fibrobacter sp.]|nr:hypothetical protein [Fibrobacter sp.]
MVNTLTVKCPHCNQISEIFLSTNAYVIILNCPNCIAPIMYFERKIYLLSDDQLEALKDNANNSSIMKTLERIAHQDRFAEKISTQKGRFNQNAASNHLIPVFSGQKREKYISDDDITNLKIELALNTDSQKFIDSV